MSMSGILGLTNVHDVTLAIDHDVPVMTILDLKDIASNRVCRHRLNEVEASPLEFDGIFSAVLCNEEVQ